MSDKLYNKNFNILVLGQIISLFGSSIQRFALALYLLDLTGSASIFASILALSMIPVVFVSPIAGILADRADKKKLMVSLDVISAMVLLLYSGVILQGNDHVMIIAVVMILLSTIATIYQPAVNTCIPIITDEKHLVRANALIQQVASLSNFLGPMLAGVLYAWFGIAGVVMINMVSFLFSALMEVFLDIPRVQRDQKIALGNVFMKDMKESYHYLRYKNPIIFRMLLFSGFYNLCLVPIFSVVNPYLIKVTFGASSEVYGFAEGMIALGMIIGGAIIAWQPKAFHIRKIYQLLYLTPVAIMIMGTTVGLFQANQVGSLMSVGILTVCGMLIMGVLGVANVLAASYIYKQTDRKLLGKVLAFGAAFATLCIPMGQIVFGIAIEVFVLHINWIIYVAGLFVFGVTLLVRWNVLQIKQ